MISNVSGLSRALRMSSAVFSMMIRSFSSMPFSIRSMCFRRSSSPLCLSGQKFIYRNIQKGDNFIKGVQAGCWPLFSIYMMERGVRSTSWARCFCVQPLALRPHNIHLRQADASDLLAKYAVGCLFIEKNYFDFPYLNQHYREY